MTDTSPWAWASAPAGGWGLPTVCPGWGCGPPLPGKPGPQPCPQGVRTASTPCSEHTAEPLANSASAVRPWCLSTQRLRLGGWAGAHNAPLLPGRRPCWLLAEAGTPALFPGPSCSVAVDMGKLPQLRCQPPRSQGVTSHSPAPLPSQLGQGRDGWQGAPSRHSMGTVHSSHDSHQGPCVPHVWHPPCRAGRQQPTQAEHLTSCALEQGRSGRGHCFRVTRLLRGGDTEAQRKRAGCPRSQSWCAGPGLRLECVLHQSQAQGLLLASPSWDPPGTRLPSPLVSAPAPGWPWRDVASLSGHRAPRSLLLAAQRVLCRASRELKGHSPLPPDHPWSGSPRLFRTG